MSGVNSRYDHLDKKTNSRSGRSFLLRPGSRLVEFDDLEVPDYVVLAAGCTVEGACFLPSSLEDFLLLGRVIGTGDEGGEGELLVSLLPRETTDEVDCLLGSGNGENEGTDPGGFLSLQSEVLDGNRS